MTQLKQFSNIKVNRAFALFLLLSSFLYSNSLEKQNDTFYSQGFLELYSNKLKLNTFDDDWTNLPNYNKENEAFGTLYFDLNYNFDSLNIGFFKEKSLNLSINDGFVNTWYTASNDFTKLLASQNIGNSISNSSILGEANYYDTYGFYISKYLNHDNHSLRFKTKLYKANDFQYMKVNGVNDSNGFVTTIDYYYSNKNILTKSKSHDSNYSGLGYGFDLEYIYKATDFYIYASLLNISSYIYWDSVTKLHYDLDSNTIYKGDDGYNHKKAFGIGYYKYDINYKQKLPMYVRFAFDYSLGDFTNIGLKSVFDKDIGFNEIYSKYRFKNSFNSKVGYVLENRNLNLALGYKGFIIEVSNSFAYSNTVLQASYNLKF